MPKRPAPRRTTRPARPKAPARPPRALLFGLAAAVVVVAVGGWWLLPEGPARLRDRAEAAEAAKDWQSALNAYRSLNRTPAARARTHLGEARACLGLDLASQAEAALVRATEADPADPEPWRARLDILRTEGRTSEALKVGWNAHASVAPASRRAILRELTLALLLQDDDLPDDRARARLDRWVAADPADADALVARHRRLAGMPRPGDPDLANWIDILRSLLADDPRRSSAREALVVALIEAGEPDQAAPILDAWPGPDRDARFHRLRGRLDLDEARRPDLAASSFLNVLTDLPHDWKTRSQLARAYRALGRPADASREAALVALLRERLDPSTLVPRLATDLARPDSPDSRRDLADLCAAVGLDRLADAWRREGSAPAR